MNKRIFLTLLSSITLQAMQSALPSTAASTHGQQEVQQFSPQAFLDAVNTKVQEQKTVQKNNTSAKAAPSLEDELQFCNSVLKKIGSKGFNPDETSASGLTAVQILMICYFVGMPVNDHIRLLLKNNASVDVADELGRTPLWYITYVAALTEVEATENSSSKTDKRSSTDATRSRKEHLELVELFLSFGANPHIADTTDTGEAKKEERGISAVRVALELQAVDILQLFEKHGWIQLVQLSDEEAEALMKQMEQEKNRPAAA